jgi:formylmethanofuran dehydrogenase subunit D
VTIAGTLVADPQPVGDHEHLTVLISTGDRVEVDHNVGLSQWVPAHMGDALTVHGQLYIDPGPHAGIHCTHAHTSTGCPVPGWIVFKSAYYQ